MSETNLAHEAVWQAVRLAEIRGGDAFKHFEHSKFAEEILASADKIHAWLIAHGAEIKSVTDQVTAPAEVAEAAPAS